MPHWKTTPIHVLDFEGGPRTGIVEYGVATLHQGEIVATATRLCAPAAPVPLLDTQCHGLDDTALAGAAPVSADWEFFAGLRRGGFLAAHHAPVEQGLLKQVWPYPGAMPDHARPGQAANDWGPWVDTHRIAVAWHPRLADGKLGSLVEWFCLGKKLEQLAARHCPPRRGRFHCALYDALAAALLLRHLCAQPGRLDTSLETLLRDSLGTARQADRMQGELELF